MKRRPSVIIILIVVCILGGSYYFGQRLHTQSATQKINTKSAPNPQPTTTPTAQSFNRTQYSLDDPSSIWVVVNKKRALAPTTYTPTPLVVPDIAIRSNITASENHVRSDTAAALKIMFDAALKEKVALDLQSGYRSYSFQTTLYNGYVQTQGKAVADTQSARPGFSEHQTGLAADLGSTSQPACDIEECFADTVEGKWLAAHAHEYGFIIRYPMGLDATTGYIYEPWHVRYVGIPLATQMHNDAVLTLEDFFKLPAAPDYN